MDEEDLLDEYDDPALKSVDELLNELQQEDDYVADPQWSAIDDLNDDIEEVEIDLGDDPLDEEEISSDIDLAAEDESPEAEDVTPSQELEEYPELELDYEDMDSSHDEAELPLSQTEQDLANAMAGGQEIDNLEHDFDDEQLIEDDFISNEALEDELDVSESSSKLEQTIAPEGNEAVDIVLNDESEIDALIDDPIEGNEPETSAQDEVVDDTELQLSQAEQDLAEAMSANENSDTLEQDFDDEPLIGDELLADDEKKEPVFDSQFDDLNEEGLGEIANDDVATELESSIDETSLSDDELDDDFMADLTQTDFDALLSELGEPEPLNIEDSDDFDVDFDALLNEDLTELNGISDTPSGELENPQSTPEPVNDEFVDIDALIEQSDDASPEHEPYDDIDMDVGLSEYDALLAGENPTDVDLESGGYSAKLDLARAYIEIDDMDSALDAIEDVIANGPEEVQQEAQSLKAKLV